MFRFLTLFNLFLLLSISNSTTATQITVSSKITSKYINNGFDLGDDIHSLQSSVKVGISDSNISVMYWNNITINNDDKQYNEHDIIINYAKEFDNGISFFGYGLYYYYPNWRLSTDKNNKKIDKKFDGLKTLVGLSFNKAITFDGEPIIPTYKYYHWFTHQSDLYQEGGLHEFSLRYTHDLSFFYESKIKTRLGLLALLNYHTGFFGVESGISNTQLSADLSFNLSDIIINASLNQQFSYEDSVNSEDETWFTLGVTLSF
jgi:hypothetical protein